MAIARRAWVSRTGSATVHGASSAAIRVAETLPGAETGSVRNAIKCDRVRTHKGCGYDNVDQSTLTRRLSPSLRLSLRRLFL